MSMNSLLSTKVILDSINDDLYACDKDRAMVYCSKSAERITGWHASDVVGRKCSDGVLCHVDKDGRRLSREEFCPLHRSMVTDKPNPVAMPIFGLTHTGQRKPMLVSVGPIHDEDDLTLLYIRFAESKVKAIGSHDRYDAAPARTRADHDSGASRGAAASSD